MQRVLRYPPEVTTLTATVDYDVCSLTEISLSHLGSVVRFVVDLKPQGPRFDPGLANYVYRTMLDNNLGSLCVDKHKRAKQNKTPLKGH